MRDLPFLIATSLFNIEFDHIVQADGGSFLDLLVIRFEKVGILWWILRAGPAVITLADKSIHYRKINIIFIFQRY